MGIGNHHCRQRTINGPQPLVGVGLLVGLLVGGCATVPAPDPHRLYYGFGGPESGIVADDPAPAPRARPWSHPWPHADPPDRARCEECPVAIAESTPGSWPPSLCQVCAQTYPDRVRGLRPPGGRQNGPQ